LRAPERQPSVRIEELDTKETVMKRLLLAAGAALALTGCIAVPAPYPDAYYYPAPAVGVGIYAGPGFHHHSPRGHYRHRGYRHWR
jgi:hypothetical protein